VRVLVIERDEAHRSRLVDRLSAAGIAVAAVGGLAEIERWSAADVVITEAGTFTGWWRHVGMDRVVVLADSVAQGREACAHGASAWLPRTADARTLVAVVRYVSARRPA
jgi:hypothetical protein